MSDSPHRLNSDSLPNMPGPAPRWPMSPRPNTSDEDDATRFNHFDSSDLGNYSTLIETSGEIASSLPQPPASPASSFGSMDSGVSHPPRAERRAKKMVSMRYRDFANRPAPKTRETSGSNIGKYLCDVPGCTAEPFQSEYLLKSHANVHSRHHLYFCLVAGCPRGKEGKGFKRKNEYLRHQLVHNSPGYICPFCRDGEHKYRRPDQLQRHVRVNHPNKSRDDPQLQEALSRRRQQSTNNDDVEELATLREHIKRVREENEILKCEIEKTSQHSLAMAGQISELQDALQRLVG